MVPIIIAQPENIFIYLPLYIAREELDFELINCGNDDAVIQAVQEGRANICVGDPIMFDDVEYGKLKVVSGFINKTLLHVITFDQFLKDISGKTMVTYPTPSTSYRLSEQLAKKYDLHLIETPFNTELGPLLTQEADIALILEPNYTQAVRNNARVLLDLSTEVFAFTGFIAKKKDEKFFKALEKAIKTFYTDDEMTLRVAKKYFLLDEKALVEAIHGLREKKPYSLKFTDKEIKASMKLKKIKYEKYKDFFTLCR